MATATPGWNLYVNLFTRACEAKRAWKPYPTYLQNLKFHQAQYRRFNCIQSIGKKQRIWLRYLNLPTVASDQSRRASTTEWQGAQYGRNFLRGIQKLCQKL